MQTTIKISKTTALTITETDAGATASLTWHGAEVWSKDYADHDLQEAAYFASEDTETEIATLRKADALIKRFRKDLAKCGNGAFGSFDFEVAAFKMRDRREHSLRKLFSGVWGNWAAESKAYDLLTAEIRAAVVCFEAERDAARKAEIASIRADYDARIAHLSALEIGYLREIGTLGRRP